MLLAPRWRRPGSGDRQVQGRQVGPAPDWPAGWPASGVRASEPHEGVAQAGAQGAARLGVEARIRACFQPGDVLIAGVAGVEQVVELEVGLEGVGDLPVGGQGETEPAGGFQISLSAVSLSSSPCFTNCL